MDSENDSTAGKKTGSLWCIFMHADGVDKVLMSLGSIGSILDGLTMPVSMILVSRLINRIGTTSLFLPQNFSHNINELVMFFCYAAAVQWVACFFEGYCWSRTAERQASALRIRYLKAMLRQDIGYFDLHVTSMAEVVTNVSSDSLVIQGAISDKVPTFLMNLSTFIAFYVVAVYLGWRVAVMGIPFIALLVIPGMILSRFLISTARKAKEEYAKAGTVVEQAISSIRTVYSFVGETKTIEKYSAALQGTLKMGLKQGFANGLVMGMSGVFFGMWSFMSYYGGRLVIYHGYQGGNLLATGLCVILGGLAFGSCLATLKHLFEAIAAAEGVMQVIERVPKIDLENMEGEILQEVSGEVEFRHVSFAYPSRPESIIFKDLSFKVPSGKAIALVGESGSGKSTVIALLQRFYDPLAGEIHLDGVSIDKLQLKWLRSQMGLVSQEPALFATTIKENILFGKEDASMDDVVEAAKASNAHNFISHLPQGYDTQVGERAVQLSGGEKQRIAIARAIIRAPKILLLDEATSALDAESERIVQEALDKAAHGRSSIIIAHRLSTIKHADVIIVVQNGQVMETGSQKELIADGNSLYATLVKLQQTQIVRKNANVITSSSVCNTSSDRYNISSSRLSIGSISSSLNSYSVSHRIDNAAYIENRQFHAPSFKRLLAMNFPELRQATIACLSAVIYGGLQPAYSYILGATVSAFFLKDKKDIKKQTDIYSWSFMGIAILAVAINIIQHYFFAFTGEHLTKRIREKMLSKMLTFEIGWFDRDENTTGAIYSRLENDANMVRSQVGDRILLLIQAISTVTIAGILGLVIAWRFALVVIALQPIIVLSYYCKVIMLQIMSNKSIESQAESSKLAAEAVSNLRTVTAFSSQSRILEMLKQAQEGPRIQNLRQSWVAGIGLAFSQSLMTLSGALNFWYGGKLLSEGHIRAKAFFQTMFVLMGTGQVIGEAVRMNHQLAKVADSVRSVFAVIDRISSIEPEEPEGIQPDEISGHIELKRVDFSYPARPDVIILRGFNLEIKGGKSTALVGQSGCGKSTVLSLILRFYDPVKGAVKIDGKDIKTYNLRSLRRHMALVSQEPMLFADTIRQNITYGSSKDVDESEITEAAKAANAHDFIAGLEDGYETWCGDKGVQLSGGQKQRIAIARAILKNPAILLLDEATSALDSQSEKVVQDALERVMVGRTTLVVAHRLSTIQKCDTIVVLDDKGKVVEKGSHSSLLAMGTKGAYYSLVNLQTIDSTSNSIQ